MSPTTTAALASPPDLASQPQEETDRYSDFLDLDVSLVDSGPVADMLVQLTGNGCGQTCESACPASCK